MSGWTHEEARRTVYDLLTANGYSDYAATGIIDAIERWYDRTAQAPDPDALPEPPRCSGLVDP